MGRMSNAIVVGLTGVLLVVLGTACGASGASGKTGTPASTTTATSVASVPAATVADLAPTGKLRVAFVPDPPVVASKDPSSGQLVGIGVDLAKTLAARLGVPFEATQYDSPPAVLAAINGGQADIGFLPVNPALEGAVDFTAPYMMVPHTYLVGPGSSIRTIADADKMGVRIASEGTAGHTAILAARLKNAQLIKVVDNAAGIAALKSGQVDAFASGRFNLLDLAPSVPGSHVVDDNFFVAPMGVAVAHGHPIGLAFLRQFVEELKASGAVQQAITKTGKQGLDVAAPVPVATTMPGAAATPAATSGAY